VTDEYPPLPVELPADMHPVAKVVAGVLAVSASVGGVLLSHALFRGVCDTITAVAGVVVGVALAGVVLVASVAGCRIARTLRVRRDLTRRRSRPDSRPGVPG